MSLSKNRLIFLTVLLSSFLFCNALFAKGKADSKTLPELIKQTIENSEETTSSWSVCKVSDKKITQTLVSPLDNKEQALAVFIYLELPEEKYGIAKNGTLYSAKPSSYFRNEFEQISTKFEAEGADNALFSYFGMNPSAPQETLSPEAEAIFESTAQDQESQNSNNKKDSKSNKKDKKADKKSNKKNESESNEESELKTEQQSDSKQKLESETRAEQNPTEEERINKEDEEIDLNQIQYAQNNVILIETVSQEELLRRKKEEQKQKDSNSKKRNTNQTYTLIEGDEEEPIPPKAIDSRSTNLNTTEESPSIASYQQDYLYDYELFGFPDLPDDESSVPQEKVENPDTRDQFGRTYLMKAAKAGNNWQIKTLLASGANVNLTDNDGWTALMYAARYQENTAIIQTLLEAGADVRVMNNFEISALTLACAYNNNPDIINKLLSYYSMSEKEVMNAFIMLLTNNIADEYVQIAKMKIFLAKSIPLNTYSNGKTPLMYAAQFGTSTKVIQTLLDNNANISIRSTEGKTAFEYASKNKNLPHDETYWKLNKIMNKN